jgi:adenylate cyclase class IV
MRKNIEIKARCENLSSVRRLAGNLGAQKRAILRQVDTYFLVNAGRLKLREIRGGEHRAELIWYQRPDRHSARASRYCLVPVSEPISLKIALTSGLGVAKIVRKRRELWMFRNVRIHLDHVEKLGNFIELGAVIDRRHDIRISRKNLQVVRNALRIKAASLLAESYSDLM